MHYRALHQDIMALLLSSAALLYSQALNLRGRVLEKASLFPVAGALVKLNGTTYATTTGPDGRFTLTQNSSSNIHSNLTTPYVQPTLEGKDLIIHATSENQNVKVEFYNAFGQNLSTSHFGLRATGLNRINLSTWPDGNFVGFIKVTVGEVTSVLRAITFSNLGLQSNSRVITHSNSGNAKASSTKALRKTAAGGAVDVSMDKLLPKSVTASSDNADLGDIVLDYPARAVIGVGATTPYGAEIFFDGSKGRAAAQNELATKWQDWLPATTPDDLKNYTDKLHQFKIMKDPEFESDTNRVTLMSCCNANWGYDDIQTIKTHGDAQIHVEFNLMGQYDTTENTNANDSYIVGQPGYENSGVYVQSRYEVQILAIGTDPVYHPTTHEMGALVDDYSPDKNMNKKNGLWQSYDITFKQARYDGSKKTLENGRMSVWWNGVLVHNNRIAHAPATGIGKHSGEDMTPTEYGLKLQSEGTDVRFRNIWIKPLAIKDTLTAFGY